MTSFKKRKFDVAKALMDTDEPSKGEKSAITKIVKRTLFRNAETKVQTTIYTGTLNSAATGNVFFMPVPGVGSGSDDRIGDKYRITRVSTTVAIGVPAVAVSDTIRVSMVNIKQPDQTTPATYNYIYNNLGNVGCNAYLNSSVRDGTVTEYNDRHFQLNINGDVWVSYRRDHKFKYPLTVCCTADAGATSSVNRNLLAVCVCGQNTANMSVYRVAIDVEYIDT